MDDLNVLASITQTAAAAFAPFISAAHPAFFGLESYSQFERPVSLHRVFEQAEYIKWNALRQQEDVRFVGLTLPHVLMRLPYEDDTIRPDMFRFREDVEGPDTSKSLWGNAAYAFARWWFARSSIRAGWRKSAA